MDRDHPEGQHRVQTNAVLVVYVSAAKGYKAGGYPNLGPNAAVAGTAYDPETALQYEVGAKTEWFDRRLRLNLSASTYYDDLQVLLQLVPVGSPVGTPGVLFTLNAADSKSKGAELEFSIAPTDRWLISGTYARSRRSSRLSSCPTGYLLPGGAVPRPTSASTCATRRKLAGNLLVRYTQPLANGAPLSCQADTRYKDKVYGDPDNLEFGPIPSYTLGPESGVHEPSGKVEIAGGVNNPFDEQYLIHNYPGLGMGFQYAGPPRMACSPCRYATSTARGMLPRGTSKSVA